MEGRRLLGKLPGEELVRRGIGDLEDGVESPASLLVSIGAPRLRRLGFALPQAFASLGRRFYALLRAETATPPIRVTTRSSADSSASTARWDGAPHPARTAETRTCAQRIRRRTAEA